MSYQENDHRCVMKCKSKQQFRFKLLKELNFHSTRYIILLIDNNFSGMLFKKKQLS